MRNGRVRCGRCKAPFNALEALISEPQPSSETETETSSSAQQADAAETPAQTTPEPVFSELEPPIEPEPPVEPEPPIEPETPASQEKPAAFSFPPLHDKAAEESYSVPSDPEPTVMLEWEAPQPDIPPPPKRPKLGKIKIEVEAIHPTEMYSGRARKKTRKRKQSESKSASDTLANEKSHFFIPARARKTTEKTEIAKRGTRSNARDTEHIILRGLEDFDAPANATQIKSVTAYTTEQRFELEPEPDFSWERPRARAWPWVLGIFAFVLIGVAQSLLWLRHDIARDYPETRPYFEALCAQLGCSMPWPQIKAQISIEASDLHPQAGREGSFELSGTLRNRAEFAQAYPSLEITLTDVYNRALIRKVFSPNDWLPQALHNSPAFAPGSDITFTVYFEALDQSASGYKLYAFYP
ncbi:MAG: DUF3426 domain-containing protein [Betaproteobacteria bacterium]|nr:DUF3426 domain-containing protein [Betaproteobacteria bacterium]